MKPATGKKQTRDRAIAKGKITFSSACDVEVHKAFKAMCAERGTSMAKQLEALMRGEVKRHDTRKARAAS